MYNHIAMLLNIVNAKNQEGAPVEFDVNVSLSEDLLIDRGYKINGDAKVVGTMIYDDRELTTEAQATVSIDVLCDNCGCEFTRDFVVDVNEKFVEPDYQSEEDYTLNLSSVDLTKPVENNLLSSIPTRILCKDDCKGLCPYCGKDLNNQVCNCEAIIESDEQLDNPFNKLNKLGDN